MKKRYIFLLVILVIVLTYYFFYISACNKIKETTELIFSSQGIYDNSFSEIIDNNSYNDLSSEIIYYMHEEIPRGESFSIINLDISMPVFSVDFILYGKIDMKCRYEIKYDNKIFTSVPDYQNPDIISITMKFERWKYKIYYEFPPI